MADYIDRDAAIAACYDGFADCRDDCAANIRSIPTAAAVDVVRCRNCRHYETDNGWCEFFNVDRVYDDFCSEGELERKWLNT